MRLFVLDVKSIHGKYCCPLLARFREMAEGKPSRRKSRRPRREHEAGGECGCVASRRVHPRLAALRFRQRHSRTQYAPAAHDADAGVLRRRDA